MRDTHTGKDMQASSALPPAQSDLSGEVHNSASAVGSSSHHAADYIPSGFPGNGVFGAQPLLPAAAASSSATVVHAEAGHTACGVGVGATGSNVSPFLFHTDAAAAAEWRALYGASTAMVAATAGAYRAGSTGVSFMTPIFHFTAHDATILSMEHNNHCKLLAIATSRNEILVTWTQLMPVIENMGALRTAEDDLFGVEDAPPIDERLLEWDPATMSILIDELPYACTELSWAPWQQGIYLAGLCPGHGIRIYRYSHGHWALDDCIRTTESTTCAISKHFTVACACSKGRVELWSRGAAGTNGGLTSSPSAGGYTGNSNSTAAGGGGSSGAATAGTSGSAWVLYCTLTLPVTEEEETVVGGGGTGASRGHDGARGNSGGMTMPGVATAGRRRLRDILGVGWDESGSLLAVGDQGGTVHVVACAQESTRLGEVVFHLPPTDNTGLCRQVAWAPSSGRSFLSLAMVFGACVRLVLFRRPRFMSAAGLPNTGHGGRSAGVGSNSSNTNNSSGGVIESPLQVLASALVPCEDVTKLSWNGTGTRFVTSHLDSSVNIWAVDVRYQYQATKQDGTAGSPSASGDVPAQSVGSALPEKRLNLVVSVRCTSSVHPFHAVSK